MSKRAIVTGGAGFIGSHLIDRLVADGWEVQVIDNLFSGFEKNLEHHGGKVKLIKGSITNRDLVNRTIKKGDTIWHFAALNSVPRSIEMPWETNDTNITGTLNILIAAKDNKARRVIYSASSSAYGNAMVDIKDESLPTNPISPYGVSKFGGEEYCRIFSSLYGLPTIALRYFNVFGPRQNPTSPYSAVIPKFIHAMLLDKPITIHGDGEQSRDFTFVANAAEANFLAGTKESVEPGSYNVACGVSISVNDVYQKLEKLTGYKFKINHEPTRIGDVRTSKASIEKIKKALGYKPLVTFDHGLELALTWYQENQEYFEAP
jgi:UDP-glucose 4-epimerase